MLSGDEKLETHGISKMMKRKYPGMPYETLLYKFVRSEQRPEWHVIAKLENISSNENEINEMMSWWRETLKICFCAEMSIRQYGVI
jgi:hypothetical protein